MQYFPTTQTVMADGLVYEVVRRRQWPDETGKRRTIVIARRNMMWIYGTFYSNGLPMGGVFRDYSSADVPCCFEARWDGKRCDHMSAST